MYCGQTVRRTQMKLDTQVGLGPGHIVLDRNPGPPPPKGHSPQFSAHICCGQMARWIKMPLGTEVGLDPSDIVLDGDAALPLQKGDKAPQLSAHVYCGQTAGWIQMKLGTEVGVGPGHIVLHRDPAPPPQRDTSPIFGPRLLSDQDFTWYGGRPRPRRHCVRWGPISHQKETSSPHFLAYVLWPNGWIDQDATLY